MKVVLAHQDSCYVRVIRHEFVEPRLKFVLLVRKDDSPSRQLFQNCIMVQAERVSPDLIFELTGALAFPICVLGNSLRLVTFIDRVRSELLTEERSGHLMSLRKHICRGHSARLKIFSDPVIDGLPNIEINWDSPHWHPPIQNNQLLLDF